jgi:hypothetical protein
MHQMTFQRVCAWSGMICVSLFFGAFLFAGFLPPLKPHSSAEAIARHYQDHTTGIRIGGVIMLISSLFYATFTAVISAQMRRIPGTHISAVYTQLAAGAFACLTFLVPAMILEVVAFRPDRDPHTTQALNDMFWIFLIMPWPPFLAQNWSFAYAILTDPRDQPLFPRWLAYLNVWAIIMFTPAVLLPFFKSGPFSWAGIFVIWIPALVFIAQFIANTYCLLRAIRAEEMETRPSRRASPERPRFRIANQDQGADDCGSGDLDL